MWPSVTGLFHLALHFHGSSKKIHHGSMYQYFYFYGQITFPYMDFHVFFIHSFIDRHLGCLDLSLIMNNAAINTYTYV